RSVLLPLATLIVTAALGAYDDKLSLVGSLGLGLGTRTKFGLLGLIALVAALALERPEGLGIDHLFLPGSAQQIAIGALMLPLAWLAIVGSAHAVNLTD